MQLSHKLRRIITVLIALAATAVWLIINPASYEEQTIAENPPTNLSQSSQADQPLASALLQKLEIKGRAPKTGYSREQFYNGWPDIDGCNLRQRILKREFGDTAKLDAKCHVIAGAFTDPYTGKWVEFTEKAQISKALQIDHIVALSDAWQKGAQYKTKEIRYQIATDPLNLVAADGPANMQKSDADAASWLPPNKAFRCEYVARQISVKHKYALWVTQAEHDAMANVLNNCPHQTAYGIE